MEIENTKFGATTIDGKTYEHDVVIRLSGEVVKRKKKLSEEVLRHLSRAFAETYANVASGSIKAPSLHPLGE